MGHSQRLTQTPRSGLGHCRYYTNQAFEDTLEDVERNEFELVPGVEDYDVLQALYDKNADTVINKFVLGGPFGNMTWSYYRGNKLGTAPGPKTVKYIFWPAMLEHAFLHSDVVVVNVGVHYTRKDQEALQYEYGILAERMAAFNKQPGKLAFFRDTMPQHFFNVDGSGSSEQPEEQHVPDLQTCWPAENAHLQLWRRELMEAEANPLGVLIQPCFWEMNMHQFHFNNDNSTKRDCTHFAYMVDWWVSVYDTMYRTAAQGLCAKDAAPSRVCALFDSVASQ
eukprot:SM000265S09786  [mRNA]  locus=s265:53467:54797:- [translate_table: standard]